MEYRYVQPTGSALCSESDNVKPFQTVSHNCHHISQVTTHKHDNIGVGFTVQICQMEYSYVQVTRCSVAEPGHAMNGGERK